MKQIKNYILKTTSATFFPIFLSLFMITSIIFLVKLASLTSVITMSLGELLYLYSLRIPTILYYVLPITFFIAMIINLSKLSGEYELIVIASFGFSPLRLLGILAPLALLATIALFAISFILIPQTDYLESKFVNDKKQEAQFNIKPSEYGQVFGPWFIYVEKKEGEIYQDITLFQPNEKEDIFAMASKAHITNEENGLRLTLQNGSLLNLKNDQLGQINFEEMSMRYDMKQVEKISSISDLILYWSNIDPESTKMRMFLQSIFVSILPFVSLFLYIAFGFYNPRYQKNYNTLWAIGFVTFYMIAMQKTAEMKDLALVPIFLVIWLILSYLLYRVRIKPYF